MSSLCGQNCDLCIFQERCGGCSICEVPLCNKACNKCFALCLKRPKAAAFLKDLNETETRTSAETKIDLPAHIPILPDRLKQRSNYDRLSYIAVHGGNAFSRNGEKINDSYLKSGFQDALNVDRKTAGLLEFYVRDRTLEGFWDNRKKIYKQIRELKFGAVIAPNFSVYEDAPRIDHLYNIRRSFMAFKEMSGEGIPVIPDVSWFNLRDLEFWCNEINKLGLKNISFSFQVVDVALKPSTIWKNYLAGFRYLCENIQSDVRIVVAGLVSPFRIQEVFRATKKQSLHVLNQSAFIQSRKGMLSETRQRNDSLSFDEIFYININYFNMLYESMNKSSCAESKDIYQEVMNWGDEQIKDFYKKYPKSREELMTAYGVEDDTFDKVVLKVIERVAIKKKVKYTGDIKGE